MFKMITWPQYLLTVVILLVLYYAYVALVYYRAEVFALVTGKGKAAGDQAAAPTPTSLLKRGSLISKSAAVIPVPEVVPSTEPGTSDAPKTDDETDEEETTTEAEQPTTTEGEQDAMDEAKENVETVADNKEGTELSNYKELFTEKISSFTTTESDQNQSAEQAGSTEPVEEFDDDFTVGVAQLDSYLNRAAEGKITQEELVKELPALENTELLVAFFKNSTKSAQQLTATIYADVAEPVMN